VATFSERGSTPFCGNLSETIAVMKSKNVLGREHIPTRMLVPPNYQETSLHHPVSFVIILLLETFLIRVQAFAIPPIPQYAYQEGG